MGISLPTISYTQLTNQPNTLRTRSYRGRQRQRYINIVQNVKSQKRDDHVDGVSKFHREQLWFNLEKGKIREGGENKQFQNGQEVNQLNQQQYWETWTEKRIQEVLDLEYEVDASEKVEKLLNIVEKEKEGVAEEQLWEQYQLQESQGLESKKDQEQLQHEQVQDQIIIQHSQISSQQSNEQKVKTKKSTTKRTKSKSKTQKSEKDMSKQNVQNEEILVFQSTIVKSSSAQLDRNDRRKKRREGSTSAASAAAVGAYIGMEAGAVMQHTLRQVRYQSSQATQLSNLPLPPLNSKRYKSTPKKPSTFPQTSNYVLLKYSNKQPKLSNDEKFELAALAQQGIKIARIQQNLQSELQRQASVVDVAIAMGWSIDVVRERSLNGRRAREVLIRSHLSMVVSIANKYQRKVDVALEDLVAEGLIGLNVGIEKHDIQRGASITTTLFLYARKAIWSAVASEQSVVCIPKSSREQAFKVKKVLRDKPNATNKEIAKLCKLKESNVERARINNEISEKMLSQLVTIKDKQVQRDVTESLEQKVDRICDEEQLNEQQAQEAKLCVTQMFSVLEDDERQLLTRYYGLGSKNQENVTQMKLAKEMNISRSSLIKQLDGILQKLRNVGKMDGLIQPTIS